MGKLNRWFVWLVIGDLGLTFGAYTLIFLARYGGFPAENWSSFLNVAPITLGATVLVLMVYNGYRDLHRSFLEVAAGCVLSALIVVLLTGLGAYLDIEARALPRVVWVMGGVLQAVLLPLWRSLFVRAAKRSYFRRPAILVSHNPLDARRALPDYIRIADTCQPGELLGYAEPLRNCWVIVAPDISPDNREVVLEWAMRNSLDVHVIPRIYDVLLASSTVAKLGDRPVIAVRPLAVPAEYRWLKRALDVTASLALLIAFLPAWLLLPIIIKLDSKGSVFFKQERSGENGTPFMLLKFRTMVHDAEAKTGPVWAQTNDPRVTRIGRILRASRLDEIPQLINVLKGDMSIVGPRPERPVFVAQFTKENPNFALRQLVKPGLTGLAQVMGRYDTAPADKLRYDLLYIAQYSPWLDLRILLWTVQVVLCPQSWVDRPPGWVKGLGLEWHDHTATHLGD